MNDENEKKPVIVQLRRLQDQHRKLERELEHYGLYAGYSSAAHMKELQIKKEKLKNKEEITELLRKHGDLTEATVDGQTTG